ncbi:hypothetical protein HAX54_033268, partial [Datura stramonium]|nr:hypothetical protein [Datura stramonium]
EGNGPYWVASRFNNEDDRPSRVPSYVGLGVRGVMERVMDRRVSDDPLQLLSGRLVVQIQPDPRNNF